MVERPEVTVVVVSFNHARFVTETLDSISAQTYAPARVLVIDDASTDDSASIIDAWAKTTHRESDVHLRSTNRGLCANLNDALARVTTPLYAYISADDRMLPQRLERQVQRWMNDGGEAVAVYSDALRIDGRGRRLTPDYGARNGWSGVPEKEGHLFEHLLRHNWLPAASVLVDTAAARSAGGYDDSLFYEDHDLWVRLARAGRILCVDEPLVEVRELDSSLGSTHFHDDGVKYQTARLHIMVKNFGVSPEGDSYLRHVMPVLAVRLWQAGSSHELVTQALALTSRRMATPGLAARLALLRMGFTGEPRMFRMARRLGGALRSAVNRGTG